jgi:hypothetical protein
MQRLEVSGVVRPIWGSLGIKGLKVNSSARGLIFALDRSGCSSSHPVCLIPEKEPLVPSEKDVLGLSKCGRFHEEKTVSVPAAYSHVACSLIALYPLTARSKYISFPS